METSHSAQSKSAAHPLRPLRDEICTKLAVRYCIGVCYVCVPCIEHVLRTVCVTPFVLLDVLVRKVTAISTIIFVRIVFYVVLSFALSTYFGFCAVNSVCAFRSTSEVPNISAVAKSCILEIVHTVKMIIVT